jgi:hypothetical protein
MAATHSTKWFWSDWLGDEAVRRLTPAERGMWIDLLALASVGNPVGYVTDNAGKPLSLDEICRVTNAADVNEVAELVGRIVQKGAASRDRTGRLFNRRMAREASLSAKRRRNGQLGGERNKLKWQGINDLLRQNARQVPRQKIQPPSSKERKITSTEYVPREEPSHVAAMRERLAKKRSAEKSK